MVKGLDNQSEFKKCSKSFEYFLLNHWRVMTYCHRIETITPNRYQIHIARLISQVKEILINTARQMGITTILVAYSAWLITFKPNQIIVVTSISDTVAKEFLDKFLYSYGKLPVYDFIEQQKPFFIRFKNGSELHIISPTANVPNNIKLAIIDNADFISNLLNIQEKMLNNLNEDGCLITASTIFHDSEFLKQCVDARDNYSDAEYIEIKSDITQRKTGRWFEKKVIKNGKLKAKVETSPQYYIENNELKHINNYED